MDCNEHAQQAYAKTHTVCTSSRDTQRSKYTPGPWCVAATEHFSIRLVYMLDHDSLANRCLQLLGRHTMLQVTPQAASSDMH